METSSNKKILRDRRHARVRSRVHGTALRPRLAVFRSNRYVYAQLINDDTQTTIAASDSRKVSGATTTVRAGEVGRVIAEVAKKQGIEAAVFDRGGFQYQGVVAAVAEGARNGGLVF